VNRLINNIEDIYSVCNLKYNLNHIIHYMEFVMEIDISIFRFQLFSVPNKQMVEIFS
jgi:hypothetical protein